MLGLSIKGTRHDRPDDTGSELGRAVAGRLVYDPSIATVDEATLNELVAHRKRSTPKASWQRAEGSRGFFASPILLSDR